MKYFTGINVVSLSVTDLDESKNFYGNILAFGKPLYDLPELNWIEFQTGSEYGNIAIKKAESGWKPDESTTIVLNTDDCYKTINKLRALNVKCDEPEVVPGYIIYASFYDPSGNKLQMCSEISDKK